MATKFITPSWRMPKNSNQSKASNYSLDFDGSNTKITFDPITLSTNCTLSAWAKRGSTANMFLLGNTGTYGYGVYFNGTSNLYIKGTGAGVTTFNNTAIQTALARTDWVHWLYIKDTTAGTTSVYVDGNLAQSVSTTNAINEINSIGGSGLASGTQYIWNGSISQVSIFDYALSTGSISALYNNGIPSNPLAVTTPPVAYYDLGQGSAYASGSAGIIEPNLAAATGSTVFEFDGNNGDNDEIDTKTTLSQLGFPATTVSEGSFTVSFWYNANTHVNYAPVVWSSTNYNLNDGFGISQQLGTTQLRFWVGRYGLNWVATSGLNTSQWYHIVAVFTGGSTYSLQTYVDGVPGSTSTGTTSYNITSSSNPLHLGSSGGGHVVSYPLDGKLSNAQVWNTNLSDSEITTLYNNGTPLQSNIPQSGSLKAWYKLGLDTSVYDTTNTRWAIEDSTTPYNGTINFQI